MEGKGLYSFLENNWFCHERNSRGTVFGKTLQWQDVGPCLVQEESYSVERNYCTVDEVVLNQFQDEYDTPLNIRRWEKVTIFIVDWVDKTCLSRFIQRRNCHVRYTRVRSSASRNKFFLISLSYVISFVIQLNRYETASVDILDKRAEIYWNQRPEADNRNYLVDVFFVVINSKV